MNQKDWSTNTNQQQASPHMLDVKLKSSNKLSKGEPGSKIDLPIAVEPHVGSTKTLNSHISGGLVTKGAKYGGK